MRSLPLLFALAPLAACDDKDGVDCTAEAVVSVTVSLTDASGVPLDDSDSPVVTYTGADGVSGDCEPWPDGGTWACGFELAGEITVTADAWGYDPASASVTVENDVCHVLGESLTLSLDSVACTEEARPSMLITVVDGAGDPVSDATVAWGLASEGAVSACETYDSSVFACGVEVAGDLVYSATAPGHTTVTEAVTVAEDECHVLTESRTATLDWLPD